jgi:hypothetical protein
MIPRAQAAGLWEATVLAAIGGIGAIILDSTFGVLSSGGVKGIVAGAATVAVHAVAAIIAFRGARAWVRSSPQGRDGEGAGGWRALIPFVNAFGAFCFPYIVLPVEAVIGWRRIGEGRGDLVPHPGDAERAQAEYEKAVTAWQERIVRSEAADRQRFDSATVWYPVRFADSDRMTCVFGGTSDSWTAALTTLGASLLGSGAKILIGDLSRRVTADVLCGLARTRGLLATEAILPGDVASTDLFARMSWDDLSTVLVEVLHSAQRDLDVSRRERQADRSVIREVADCLHPSSPISIACLRQALLIVQGSGASGDGACGIDAGVRDRLATLFSEAQLLHGEVMARVTRIERALRDFDALDDATLLHADAGDPLAGAPSPATGGGSGELHLIGIDKQADELESDRLADLLFQLLLRGVRRGVVQADVLIVLGADRIRREALESLMTHAEHGSTGVVAFFEHLRRDAIEIVGTGGAAAAFLALGNHREAKEASEFIGSEYKWIESRHTASASESLTQTSGHQESTSTSGVLGLSVSASGPSGSASLERSRTKGRSYSEAFGQSSEYATAEERVREAVVAPEVLMGLPATGMIRVAVLPGGRRAPVNIDCHPDIATSARAAREPHAQRSAG